jgi:hypothetical protein
VFGIEEHYEAKLCGHNEGKAWLVEIIDEAANVLMTPTERNRFPRCRQKSTLPWPSFRLVIALHSPTALLETGLRICCPEKSGDNAPFAAEQCILCSPVCRANIAENGHLSRLSGGRTAEFLCT